MKHHERLFLSRHTAMGGISKVLQYLTEHLPKTFHHPFKTMEDCEMLSFLRGILQIYLEFWNSTDPFAEFIPDQNIVTETTSLLKHIRICQYLPNINTVECMEQLQKLNIDLISILDNYFDTNIWTDIQ